MFAITTLEGPQLTATTTLELAQLLADHELGPGWDDDGSPFEQHSMMWEYIETIGDLGTQMVGTENSTSTSETL